MTTAPKNENQSSAQETLQEERYLWMARAFALVALLSFVANFLMLVALSGLTPLMRVQPFYLQTQAKDHQVIAVFRPNSDELNSDILQESLVREYLLARYGIGADKEELRRRWGLDGNVASMSETSVFQEFNDMEYGPAKKRDDFDTLTRDVRINVVNRKERYSNGGVWVAEIELIEMSEKLTERNISRWAVKMEVAFQTANMKVEWRDRLKNPLGFSVKKFGRTPLKENSNAL